MSILLVQLIVLLNPEPDGYLIEPAYTRFGIVATDNNCTAIYLIHNEKIEKLFSTPGCGRYFSVSPGGNLIGLKIISENGKQTPALLDLSSGRIATLHEPAYRSGQVSFSNTGKIAFTINNDLIVIHKGAVMNHNIGNYANLAPISPDGNYVVYNDKHDQLWLLDLQTNEKKCFTNSLSGYCYPSWSPDSRLIAFSTLDEKILIYQLSNSKTFEIGRGRNPDWSPDSKHIIYHDLETDGRRLLNSDLFLSKYDASEKSRLTSTTDKKEMDVCFASEHEIIFHTYDQLEIIKSKITGTQLHDKKVIYKLSEALELDYWNVIGDFGPRDSIDVPYINQVYDTPDWHNGNWSCAPTTAMMAIAYYRKLPYWDCWCSSPYGHTSHFGNYICSIYNYREVTYDLVAQDAGGYDAWGGYGYMWYNGYSPYSRMMDYLQYHDITSWSDDSPTWAETAAEVQAGWPYCMCVGLTTAGHLILAVGQVLDWHTLIFNDPYGNKNLPSYPNYDGKYSRYDWPGYNNGYENLNQVYWCRGAHGGWVSPPDTIVDDMQFQYTGENYGFYMYNDSPSTQRYFRDNLTGYNGHMWWTYTTAAADTCYVTWTPNLTLAGNYEVFVYVPSVNSNADARYQIHYNGGTQTVVVDQANYSDQWVSLGTFLFGPSGSYVYLGDATGTSGQHIGFDVIRWSLTNPAVVENTSTSKDRINLGSTLVEKDLVLISHQDRGQLEFSVFDITGQLVLKDKAAIHNSNQHVIIGVSRLAAGVYFLKASISGHEYSEKFIKLR